MTATTDSPDTESVHPVLVSVRFRRTKGAATMIVDATSLHAYLHRIGVETVTDFTGTRFADQPYSSARVVDTSNTRVSPGVLLKIDGAKASWRCRGHD